MQDLNCLDAAVKTLKGVTNLKSRLLDRLI